MIIERLETRTAYEMRRDHGSRAHARALQSLAQATEDCNPEKVAFWKYVALMLALGTPADASMAHSS